MEWIKDFIKTLSPFILGVFLAYILNPLISVLEDKLNTKRGLSIFISMIILMLTIGIVILFITPILVESIIDLFNQMPNHLEQIQKFLDFKAKEINESSIVDLEKFILTQVEVLKPELIELSKTIINKACFCFFWIINITIRNTVSTNCKLTRAIKWH